jgi:hypothetical protein
MDEESTCGMFIPLGLPACGHEIHWRNGYSAGNYQLMDMKSTGGTVIPLEITSSWT